MKKMFFKSALTIAVAAASSQLLASGFAVNEQSISGMGTGFAGRSSAAEDASTVYGNPAGMARLKREQVNVGAIVLDASTDIKHTSGIPGGSNDGDMVPLIKIPMGFYVKPINDKWAVGVGIYAPFGLATEYENGYAGRYYGEKSDVKVVTIQPTISYAINDKVSIGFGPTINRISGELDSSVIPGTLSQAKVKGDDTALGYNVGILVQATDKTRIGLTYHSMVDYKLDGHTTLSSNALPAALQGKFDASLNIKTPESTNLSLTHQLTDDITLYAGSTYTRWSRLKDITVKNSGVPAPIGGSFGTITEEQNWHDTWSHAVGAAYQLNKQWVLRTGVSIDQSPTNNADRSPRIPSGDRRSFSLGAGWSPTDDVTIDLAYFYLKEDDTKVNRASPTQGTYAATFKNSLNALGTSLTYRF